MKTLKFRLKLTSKILFISIFLLLSVNSVFAISVNTATTFQSNCPWALVNDNIYITWATQKIYPMDLIRSSNKLLFISNEDSSVSIWQNTANTLTSWCSQPLSWNTWWGRLSDVVQWNNQYVGAFKLFWDICEANKVKRIDLTRPSIQLVYRIAVKEEISLSTWISNYFYYPLVSWMVNPIPSYLPNQTRRNWWSIIIHQDECHNFTFAYCWDWTLDSTHWEACDDGNNIDWDGCSATCQLSTITCWTAGWYSFPYTTTTWPSNLTFCSTWAVVNPNPPVFPAQNWSTSWTCSESWSTVNCNASRWGTSGWSQPDCVRIELSQSWATANNTYPVWTNVWVTCIWSANTEIVKVECWDWTTATQNNTRIWNFTCVFNSPATFNPKCYVWNGATSWIPNVTSPTCSIKLSSWGGGGGWGGGGHSWFCWDWVIQRPNNQWVNEVCEASLVGWILKFPSWCVDCKTLNFTYPWEWWIILTYPGWWNILFRPYWQVIIWAWSNPFTVFGSTPYIWNDSSEELYLDKSLCVYNTDSSVLLNSDNTWFTGICSAQKIWWLRPWISKTFEELNNLHKIEIKWLKITDNTSFKDTILKTTLQWFPDAFFSTPLKVRVSKPAVATVWGWTSLIKNSKITADINKVASDWYSNQDKNKNFVWAWVSTGSTSSYSKNVNNTTSVTKISSGQTSKTTSNLTKVTTSQITWNKTISDTLTKYNWLSNVFIVKNWSLTINTSIPWTWARTYIVEWWNLYINQNITYADNIAFVVKWWNIIITSNVTQVNWTLIVIWWKITSEETDNKLVINWSLYGDIGDLVNNRTYIENKNDLINVWTVVSFGSNLFRKQAPLVWDFIWEYIASKKVAK